MRLASHLKRSPLGVYYFRLIVPKSLRPLVHGQREIKRSLHTRDPATARRLAYMLWAQTELRLREARRAMSGYDPTKFDPNDPSTWPSAAGDARGWIAKIGGVTIEADPSKPGDSESAIAAIRQLSGRGDGGSGESELGNIGVIDQFYTPPPSPPPPTAYKSVHFSEAKDDYLKIVTKEAEKGDLAAGTLIEMTGAFTRFLDWSSSPHDPQLSQIDRPMMERYMKHLLLDEPNKNTRSKGLSPGTVKKQISFLNGLFTHCKSSFPKGHDLPTENLSPYRRGTKHKTEHKARYRPFDSSELKIIFAPENLGKVRKPHEFWCPLLGLYLGARLEEICQLRLKVSEQRGDLTVLHIVSEPADAGT
ncbi:MAG: hypothetical protein OSA97_13750, partial [Nevskia sp.]|nr:hypothetical protein [Nevskia sp.]